MGEGPRWRWVSSSPAGNALGLTTALLLEGREVGRQLHQWLGGAAVGLREIGHLQAP